MKIDKNRIGNSFLNAGIEIGFYTSILTLLFITKLPLYYQGLGASISIFFWLSKCLFNQKWIYKHYPWHWTELLLCGWIWIGLAWSVQPSQTILQGIIFTSGCTIEVLLVSVFTKKQQVLRILFFLFLLLTIYALYFLHLHWNDLSPLLQIDTVWRSQLEVTGVEINFGTPIGGRNSLGGLYSLLAPFTFSIAFFGIRWNHVRTRSWIFFIIKPIFVCFSILFFAMVVFSGSRGSSIGMISGLICLVLSYLEWWWTLIAVYSTAFLVAIPSSRNWFVRILMDTLSGDMSRILIWQNSVALFKLLWIGGTGLGTFQHVYKEFFPPQTQNAFIHAHNIFFNVGIELGLIGVILFSVLALQLIFYGIALGRKNRFSHPFYASIQIGLASMVFGYLVRCLFDYTI
ncbi:MAG: O-antigen ligase family protein [Caldisericia bacterium]|nr:O-antigen ligase family protein [Caldisericia bacterium]MDD4614293.1 O-antigen ligase family protein [Caldisericia bacterium]